MTRTRAAFAAARHCAATARCFGAALCLGVTLCLGAACAAEPDPQASGFTPAEREKIAALRGDIEAGCKRDVAARIGAAAQGAPAAAASKWLNDVANSPGYCGCTADAFTQGLTPAMLKASTEDEARLLMRRAAVQCLLPKLKTSFPESCKLIVTEPLADGSAPRAVPGGDVGKFCGCVQPTIDAVTVDNYDDFLRATAKDYTAYRKSGSLETTTPGSLLAGMQACGLQPARPPAR